MYAGATCCLPLIDAYLRGDGRRADALEADGAEPGFLYWSLAGVRHGDDLRLRERVASSILEIAGEDAVTFTGGATGTARGYLDFIAWDLGAVLDAAAEVLRDEPVAEAGYHPFRTEGQSIRLK